ncbi:MAG TPA: DUF1573 domain-containing protein [Candidatus Binatia bacterium]|nr:DUF1573 domain-containing protein [Candidatus Binatia bacterium]
MRLLAGVFVLLGAVLGAAPRAGAADAAPRLEIEKPVFDFGTVEQGTRVEHAFKVRNGGSASLQVSKVDSSCGCTAGVSADGFVGPGRDTWITVTLDTTRISGRTAKTVIVHSNDPTVPEAALSLTGQVVTDVVVNPTPLYLGRIRRGQTIRRELVISAGRPGAPHDVIDVATETPAVRAYVEAGDTPDQQRVVVEITPNLPLGRFTDELRVRTSSPRQPIVIIPVFGSIESDLAALPPQVTFDLARDETHDVQVRNRSGHLVAVTHVTATPPIAYDLKTVKAGLEWLLRLRLTSRPPDNWADGAVELFTDHPTDHRVVVPVFAIDRSRS